jgi:hypothetical protein
MTLIIFILFVFELDPTQELLSTLSANFSFKTKKSD